ncbi:MAG: cation:proton antiporter, partial [bacterium]|nr:cation:proton antiporter [bacterium]
ILFEGGLNLDWRKLRREAGTIRLLVTLGAVITAVGGMLAARLALGWGWQLSILFGTLVVVTGPTVITPLLRRIKVKHNLETVLEAEGVFIDAVGAILAVVALEIVLQPTRSSLVLGVLGFPSRLLLGGLIGLFGGFLMMLLLRIRGVVPEGLENVFALALALALFQVSDMIMPESGISAVIVAGLVLGNVRTPVTRGLKEFKEQLTVLFIGMLFVLLAANVRMSAVTSFGMNGILVVAILMFIVRPLNVWACTMRSGLNWREKLFLSWLAPRGIVAAAVASLFYVRLYQEGLEGGEELQAMVFLVIGVTVVFQGSTGALVARWLGVRRPSGLGYAILGANEIGRELARQLQDDGKEVVLLDANAEECEAAQQAGFRVVYGNALDERVLRSAELESRRGAIGTLTNEAVSLLFAEKAYGEYKVPRTYVAIQRGHGSISPGMIEDAAASVLFGHEADLDLWSVRIRRGIAGVEKWTHEPSNGESSEGGTKNRIDVPRELQNVILPMSVQGGESVEPVSHRTRLRQGDVVSWLVFSEREDEARAWLSEQGWQSQQGAQSGGGT